MPLGDLDRRAIVSNLALHDFVRRARPGTRRKKGHREWLHFFVATEGLELFVNLSLFDDLRPAARDEERARVLVLARHAGRWIGGVDEIAPGDLDVRGGQLASRFGDSRLVLEDGVMRLRGASADARIAFDLELEATSFPSLATDVRVGGRGSFNWLVVPRLRACGAVTIEGARHELQGAPAYHDHNWGHFAHHDFRWQWGHAADASSGTSVVLARLLDGVGSTAYLQSLFVWEGPRVARIFRGAELELTPRGFLRKRSFTVPALASLLAAGATEVPSHVEVEAVSGADRLAGTLELEDAACIVLGEGSRLDTTLLYEVLGRVRLAGAIAGRPVEVDAPLVFETMRSRSAA